MSRPLCIIVALLATVSLCRAGVLSMRGIVIVDDHTFPKIASVPLRQPIFMRLDKGHTWGAPHDAFIHLGHTIGGNTTSVLLLSVPISEWDAAVETEGLAAAYNVTPKENIPLFVLLPLDWDGNHASAIEYDGDFNAYAMKVWLSKKTGMFMGADGQTHQLDALARKYAKSVGDRQEIIKQIKEIVQKSQGIVKEHAEYYLKFAKKLRDDSAFVINETKRLNNILADRNVAKNKKDTIQTKLNILASFTTTTTRDEL